MVNRIGLIVLLIIFGCSDRETPSSDHSRNETDAYRYLIESRNKQLTKPERLQLALAGLEAAKKEPATDSTVTALISMASAMYRYVDLDSSQTYVFRLMRQAQRTRDTAMLARAFSKRANFLNDTHDQTRISYPDSALYYFDRSRELYLAAGDSAKAAQQLNFIATLYTEAGDYSSAERTAVSNLEVSTGNEQALGNALINLARIQSEAGKQEQAIANYQKALQGELSTASRIYGQQLLANLYSENGQYEKALELYGLVDTDAFTRKRDSILHAGNVLITQWRQSPSDTFARHFLERLRYRESIGDRAGVYYEHKNLIEVLTRSNPAQAQFHATQAVALSRELGLTMELIDDLETLSEFQSGDAAAGSLKTLNRLQDSVRIARERTQDKLALIAYRTREAQQESERLSTELQSSQELMRIQAWVNFLLIALVLLITIATVLLYRWIRVRNQQKLEQEQAATAQRLSKQVHDELAGEMYGFMMSLENEGVDESSLDKGYQIYEQARNLSHAVRDTNKLSDRVRALAQQFTTAQRSISLDGLQLLDLARWSAAARDELFLVLRELLVNLDKHSATNKVSIQVTIDQDEVRLKFVESASTWLPDRNKGSGLQIMENRISEIGGTISFETSQQMGLITTLIIPVGPQFS